MKRFSILLAFLTVCLFLISFAFPAQADGWGETIFWEFDAETGTLTISGTGEMIKGSPWNEHRLAIKKVIIQEGITSISENAFRFLSYMTDISLPQSLRHIGNHAFYNCQSLTEIHLNEGLETIDYNAFDGCTELKTITLPDSLQELKKHTFFNCKKLESVHFGAGISQVSYLAFQGCTNLTTFTLSENNPYFTLHQNALYSRTLRKLVIIAYGYAGEHVVLDKTISISDYACYGAQLASITIPGTVTTIGKDAFSDCKNLKTVILHEGIQSIAVGAFRRSGITEITFPASLNRIESFAFDGCSALKTITFLGLPPQTNQCFFNITATVYYPGYLKEWKDAPIIHEAYDLTYIPDCQDKHDLRWGEEKAPTCTEPGLRSESWCVICRKEFHQTEVIPATGHSYGAWTEVTAPSTEATGLAVRTCSVCGATEEQTLEKPPATEPPATEPPATKPPCSESTETTVTTPTTQTAVDPSEEHQAPTWARILSVSLLSILIGLTGAFLLFASKKLKKT